MSRPDTLSLMVPKSNSPVTSTSPSHYPPSPEDITSLPPCPDSPVSKYGKDASKGFLANLKSTKSAYKLRQAEPTIRQVSEDIPRARVVSKQESIYALPKITGSTPNVGQERQGDSKPKPKFGNIMNRTRSTRLDESGGKTKFAPRGPHLQGSNTAISRSTALSSSKPNIISAGFREGGSSHLLANLKNRSDKASNGLQKAKISWLSRKNRKTTGTGKDSGTPKDSVPGKEDGKYIPRVLNLPLIEQTRFTRIAPRLEYSKDKTEFWMPALPWRCIE